MKKTALVFLLWVVVLPTHATISKDIENPALSLVDVVHRALARNETIESIVTQAIKLIPTQAGQVVGAAIVISPGSIEEIVQSALAAGTTGETIAEFCRSALTVDEVTDIVAAMMRHKVKELESILATCLSVVPAEQFASVLATTLQNVEEDLYEMVISVAYDSAVALQVDPVPLMTMGIARSGVWSTLDDLNQNGVIDVLEDAVMEISMFDDNSVTFEEPEAAEVVDQDDLRRGGEEPVASES